MRTIKFRQRNKNNGQFHYWGAFKSGEFTGPMTSDNHVGPEESNAFTGLLDKNGKEIYEGDITITNDGSTGKIVWNEKLARFDWNNNYDSWPLEDEKYPESVNQTLEVIGNIYENPELLRS